MRSTTSFRSNTIRTVVFSTSIYVGLTRAAIVNRLVNRLIPVEYHVVWILEMELMSLRTFLPGTVMTTELFLDDWFILAIFQPEFIFQWVIHHN